MKFCKKKLMIYFASFLCFFATLNAHAESIILIAAGSHYSPFLVASEDNGNTWVNKTPEDDLSKDNGYFAGSSCAASISSHVCVAVGKTYAGENQPQNDRPLLSVSQDGGKTWSFKKIDSSIAGFFSNASCIKYNSNTRCIVVGEQNSSEPLFAMSDDNGNTWSLKKIKVLPKAVSFLSNISCTGSDSTAICSMVGDYANRNQTILMTSHDGGNTWENSLKTLKLPQGKNSFLSTSCSGEGELARCVAVGENRMNYVYSPLIAVSTDGAKTWTIPIIPGMPSVGALYSSSCTGSGVNAVCAVVGRDLNSASPILAVSTDGGLNWTTKKLNSITEGALQNVSCIGNGDTATCIAAGPASQYKGTNPPIMVISMDGGHTWNTKTMEGLSSKAYFYSTHCTANQSTSICLAGGSQMANEIVEPLLALSTDAGNHWMLQNMKNILNSGSSIYTVNAINSN